MIDIKTLREETDLIRANMERKGRSDTQIIEETLAVDKEYLSLLQEEQSLRSQRNKASEEINRLKKAGEDITGAVAAMKEIPVKIKALEEQTQAKFAQIQSLLQKIPNIMHESVPQGKTDDDNVELERFGEPTEFDFEPVAHQVLARNLGMLNADDSAQTSGTGFYYMQGPLALLNQALIRYAIDTMVENKFTYVETPLMLRQNVVENVVSLDDQEEQIYKIEGEDLHLIGTSEHSLIGRYLQKTVHPKELPLKHTSYSMCFRREKGSHGLDERGLFRTHQFNKVEMIVICRPEESADWYDKMQNITIKLFKGLGLPIRVLQMCTADLNDLKHVAVDIEAWSPRKKGYIEVASCSNLTNAQSLQLGIRANGDGEKFVPHTLNNTAIATSRALVAILENFQTKEGTVKIPEVLHKYMYGITELKKE